MNQPKQNWESRIAQLQKRLEDLAVEKEMLKFKVQKAYNTLEQIKVGGLEKKQPFEF